MPLQQRCDFVLASQKPLRCISKLKLCIERSGSSVSPDSLAELKKVK